MSDSPATTGAASAPRYVPCPQCGGQSLWHAENRFRPFCSERCKLIDLGAWASEGYRVPVEDDDSLSDTLGQ